MTRRRFLRASARAALAAPAVPGLLVACTGEPAPNPSTPTPAYRMARPDGPVTLPIPAGGRPIDDGLKPETNGALDLYTWPNYVWRFVVERFAEQFGATFRIETFTDVVGEAIPRLASGAAMPDVAWTTFDTLSRIVAAGLLLPLNHSYIPNLRADVWPRFRDPFYDQGWRYSVPYAVYTTGIAYRRDRVDDDEVARKGWAILWDPRFAGKVGLYDDYREAIALALLRRGVTDINTSDPAALARATRDLRELIDARGARPSADGVFTHLAPGEAWLHQSRSGDVIAAQSYLPAGDPADVLGYWWPRDGRGPVANDVMVIPLASDDPVLAHRFLNFLLDGVWAMRNFGWTGYQPPTTSIDTDGLVAAGVIADSLAPAVVREADLGRGLYETELPSAVDRRWQEAWRSVTTSD